MRKIIASLVVLAFLWIATPAHAAAPEARYLPDHVYAKIAGQVHDLGKISTPERARTAFAGAQARTYNGCPQYTDAPIYAGYICLYQDTNYNSGMWGAAADDFAFPWSPTGVQYSHCVNLQDRTYNTGGNVNNTAGSISVTADPRPSQQGTLQQRQSWYWILFDWVNCNWNSDYIFMNVNTTWSNQQFIWHQGQVGENYFWNNATSLRMVSAGELNKH